MYLGHIFGESFLDENTHNLTLRGDLSWKKTNYNHVMKIKIQMQMMSDRSYSSNTNSAKRSFSSGKGNVSYKAG